ncbi:MAG TPA: hypothetical protein VFA38_07765 [Nitrospirales bacterium]|nr:hypothetical protein [Nitrospirales bacterium]
MILSAKVLWPLFPLLLLVVVICLVWALVHVVRRGLDQTAVWLQGAALSFYVLAAVAAIASERGAVSAHLHRPFSLLTQLAIALALFHHWGKGRRHALVLNATAWAAILGDTALHYLLSR